MARFHRSRRRAAAKAAICALVLGASSCANRILYTTDPDVDGSVTDSSAPDVGMGACSSALVGFASLGDSTTGGGLRPAVVPTTQQELQDYLDMTTPLVIQIKGTIAVTGQVDMNINADKTIEGVGTGSGLSGGGLRIKTSGNVIVRNLKIEKATATDAITIEASNHVWIDHCDLSSDTTSPVDTYDSLIDITHGSDYVTISWTMFHDHADDVSFIGNSANTGMEDAPFLHVTLHHNLFQRTKSQNPSLRFGKVHAYNNYYKDITMIGISSRQGGQVLAERNYFDTVTTPFSTRPAADEPDGFIQDIDNTKVNVLPSVITQTATVFQPPYDYPTTPVMEVPARVLNCAGTGKM